MTRRRPARRQLWRELSAALERQTAARDDERTDRDRPDVHRCESEVVVYSQGELVSFRKRDGVELPATFTTEGEDLLVLDHSVSRAEELCAAARYPPCAGCSQKAVALPTGARVGAQQQTLLLRQQVEETHSVTDGLLDAADTRAGPIACGAAGGLAQSLPTDTHSALL